MRAAWIDFTSHNAKEGLLVSVDVGAEMPFCVERVYYICQSDRSAVRGRHAHLRGEEVVVCLRGSCVVALDDGRSTGEFILDRPDRGLHVKALLWEEFRLAPASMLLVFASTPYSRTDYVEDRAAFLALVHDLA